MWPPVGEEQGRGFPVGGGQGREVTMDGRQGRSVPVGEGSMAEDAARPAWRVEGLRCQPT